MAIQWSSPAAPGSGTSAWTRPRLSRQASRLTATGQRLRRATRRWSRARPVQLEEDVSEADRFGRLLRNVYVDGLMVNELLVREGYAQVTTFPPDVKHVDLFLAQAEARKVGR